MNEGFHLRISSAGERYRDRDARTVNFEAGKALSEAVRTTLGPGGMDKLLIGDGQLIVTNDGASIIDRMEIDHPAAKTIAEIAETQEDAAGDGTTTAVVLVGELLAQAEKLFDQGLHATTVTNGYRLAAERAFDALESIAVEVDPTDPVQLQEVAQTAITGKWDSDSAAFLAGLATEAVRSVAADDKLDFRRITRRTVPSGGTRDSALIDGLVIDIGSSSTSVVSPNVYLPKQIGDATVAIIDDQLTIETVDGMGSLEIESPEQLEQFQEYEDAVYAEQAERIADVGADIVFCQGAIDESVRYLLAKRGVLPIERTRRDELIKLTRATGATHVASVSDLTPADTGTANLVECRTVGGRELVVIRGAKGTRQVSLVLRGGTKHVVEETKRIIDDCLYVLQAAISDQAVVAGGGAVEVELADILRTYAHGLGSREQLAVRAFADSLEIIPRTLAENAGIDPVDTLIDLRSSHHNGGTTIGLDATTGELVEMTSAGIVEPLSVKRRAIASAEEAANLFVRIDDVVATRREDTEDDHEHEHDGPSGLHVADEGYPWALGHSMGH